MKRIALFIVACLVLCGCATTTQLKNIDQNFSLDKSANNGIVFGKADFKGLFKKTTGVALGIENKTDKNKTYQLYIGDKMGYFRLPWNQKPVAPEYFFIELPAGQYSFISFSFKMGSFDAYANTDIYFLVQPKSVIYLGTLSVVGNKEKIKFGLPLIQPGIDCAIDILNEQEEALKELRTKYPQIKDKVETSLMVVHQKDTGN